MKDQTTPEQTEFDFNESGETEQQRLEREVLAAGGRVGKSEGRFVLGLDDSEGCKRGDEHREIEGLYFWNREKGQMSSRWLSKGSIAELSESDAERRKMWRKHNKESISKRRRKWREDNVEKVAEGKRRYCEENKEKIAEYQKVYHEENKEKVNEAIRKWREDNPDKARAKEARRRARKLEAIDPSASKAVIESRYAAKEHLKKVTGYAWHVDHTQPLSRGGKEHENNMQVVPAKWNCSKGARHCDRWIEDSDIYRYATAVEARFEREAKKSEKK